ncbi:hypothetical protein [Serratia proteamaculans]
MEVVKREHFVVFPYKYQVRDNGDINNGGIDLTRNPERLQDIHELNEYPWLYRFVEAINAPGCLFMTFGCAVGITDGNILGYVDFSVRSDEREFLKEDLVNLDDYFYSYLHDAMPEGETRQQATQYARQSLHWCLSPLEIYGETYSKVTLTFRMKEDAGAAWVFDQIHYFLSEQYPSLPHIKNE